MSHSNELDRYFQSLAIELEDHAQKLAGQLMAHGVHFEGKPYPVSLRPLVLSHELASSIQQTVEELFRVLDTAAECYRTEQWARALFPAYRHAEQWLLAWPKSHPESVICRFDGVIDERGNFQLFETNTATPGGVIQTGLAARLWREAAEGWGMPLPMATRAQPLLEDPNLFGRTIINAHRDRTGRLPETAVITNLRGRFTNEVDWMRGALEKQGVHTRLADARDLRCGPNGKVEIASWGPVDLSYNKLSPRALIGDPEAADYLDAGAEGALSFLNPLMAQCVLEDKAVLALLTDPRFLADLPQAQQQLIDEHVPWTRLLRAGRTVTGSGATHELLDFAVASQENLVLKPTNLTRGEGVVIGPETSPTAWREAIAAAAGHDNYVVQRYVPLPRIKVPGPEALTTMGHGLDVYIFGDRAVGFQCRASIDPIVNVGRRGSLLPVIIDAEEQGATPQQ